MSRSVRLQPDVLVHLRVALVTLTAAVAAASLAAQTRAPLQLADVTRQAGITFVHHNGATGRKYLPETMGSGSAFLDFDGDGDQDLLLVNGVFPASGYRLQAAGLI